MFTACVVLSVLLAAMATLSAVLKLQKFPRVLENLGKVGLPESWLPKLAAVEVLGAVGVLVGLGVAPLGVAASLGLVAYFVGAVTAHVRARDFAGISSPTPFLLLSIAASVLRIATM